MKEARAAEKGVGFPDGASGASLFARLLEEAIAAFPGAFGALPVPDGKEFRTGFAPLVTQFEALRTASSQRAAIAQHLHRRQLESFVFRGEQTLPLLEAMRTLPAQQEPLAIEEGQGEAAREAIAHVPYLGKDYKAQGIVSLVHDLQSRHGATPAAVKALEWIAAKAGESGQLDLSSMSFAVLGASAEIAPTEALLHGGARLLWIDVKEPPEALRKKNLSWVRGGADLLAQPGRIAKTIARFAEGDPKGKVHLVACAYAPGRGREWRLAVAMNAIAESVGERAASLSMLLSPTSPALIEPCDVEASRTRRARSPLWQKALARYLREPQLRAGEATVVKSIVPIQGPTYQAAQYLAKRIAAEAVATQTPSLLVSANVMPITRTRSLQHPVFEAGFLGAPRFGVEIFDSPATRALGGLLMLHDLLNPESPAAQSREPARAAELFRQQLHGGIFGLHHQLEQSINVAAVVGLGMKPGLLIKMFK